MGLVMKSDTNDGSGTWMRQILLYRCTTGHIQAMSKCYCPHVTWELGKIQRMHPLGMEVVSAEGRAQGFTSWSWAVVVILWAVSVFGYRSLLQLWCFAVICVMELQGTGWCLSAAAPLQSSAAGAWWGTEAQQELQQEEEVDLGQTWSNVLFPSQHPTETCEVWGTSGQTLQEPVPAPQHSLVLLLCKCPAWWEPGLQEWLLYNVDENLEWFNCCQLHHTYFKIIKSENRIRPTCL